MPHFKCPSSLVKVSEYYKSGLFILFTLVFMVLGKAQSITVSGIIYGQDESNALIGATILEDGTSNGTSSDINGKFSISLANTKSKLLITYVGYNDKLIDLNGQTDLVVILEENSNMLEDVVVIGYQKKSKSSVTTAISSLKSKDIEKLVVVGLDQALQGQAPGISVTQVSGSPGDDIAVRIRGAGTLGNNNPLYIIDGVPTTGNINMFSLQDVESIEVLKDGASAAIYGARAANGVVVITTKKGKSGKPSYSFNAFYGVQSPRALPKLLNAEEFLTIRNEAIINANVLRNPANQVATYDPAILDTLPDVNWLNKVFRNAPIQQYAFSGTTGGDNSSVFIAADYLTQDGIFLGQEFDKYQLRVNGEVGSKKFKIGNNLSFAFTDRKIINGTGDGFGAGNELSGVRYALITSPLFSGKYADGSDVNVTSDLGNPTLFGDGNPNPLVFIDNTDWHLKKSRIFGNLFAEFEPLKDLKLRTSLGGDFIFEQEKLAKERLSAAIYSPTSLTEGRVFNRTSIWNTTLDYHRLIADKHDVGGLLGMEAIQNHTDYLGASARNFVRFDPLFRYINASNAEQLADVNGSGIATEWALLSFFGSFSYSYDSKYILNASLRQDGSSRFGPQNRWGLFPSLSAAWVMSNESFIKDLNYISEFKWRASWGKLGNQEIGIYPFSSLVQTGQRVYVFGDQIVTGATIAETGNSNIKWETTTQSNFGFDLGLWGDRLSFSTDVYRKTTADVLVRIPIPQSGGDQRPPYVNAASIQNEGLELALAYRNSYKDIQFNIGGNLTFLRNKVISIANSEPILGGFGLSDGPLTRTEENYPLGSFYLWVEDGLFQTTEEIAASPFQTKDTRPGDVKFKDINGDNIIDDKDRTHTGSPFPNFTYGLQLGFQWKNIDVSSFLQGVSGNDIYFLYGNFAYETQLRGFNSYADILNRWTPTNTQTDIPKVSTDDRNGNRRASTRFLYDGSYARLKNLSIGYTFQHLRGSNGNENLRLYVTMQNLLTFTKYPGLDPEIQANANDTRGLGLASDLAVGIDWGTVPAPRTITFGINLNF